MSCEDTVSASFLLHSGALNLLYDDAQRGLLTIRTELAFNSG